MGENNANSQNTSSNEFNRPDPPKIGINFNPSGNTENTVSVKSTEELNREFKESQDESAKQGLKDDVSNIVTELQKSTDILKGIAKDLTANGMGKAIEPKDSEADKGDKSSASSVKSDDNKSYGAQQDIARLYDLFRNTLHGDAKSIAGSMFQTIIHNWGDANKMGQALFPGGLGKLVGKAFGGDPSMGNIAASMRTLVSIGKTLSGWGVLIIAIVKAVNAIARSQADFRKSLIESTGGINSPILTSEKNNAELTEYFKSDIYDAYRNQWGMLTHSFGIRAVDNPALGQDEAMKAMFEATKTLPTRFMGFMDKLDDLGNKSKATDYMMAGDALSRMKAMNQSASSAIDQAFSFLMRKDAVIGGDPRKAIGRIFAAQTASADSALTMEEFMSNLNTMNNDFRLLGGTTLGNVALLKKFGDEINAGTISISDFAKGAKSLHDNSLEKNVAMGAMAVDYAMRRGIALPKDFRDTTAIGRAFYLSSSEAMKGGGEQVKGILSSAIGAIAEQMGGFGNDKMTNLGMIQMAYEKLYGIKLSSDFLASRKITDESGRLTLEGERAIWMMQQDISAEKAKILEAAGINPNDPSDKIGRAHV